MKNAIRNRMRGLLTSSVNTRNVMHVIAAKTIGIPTFMGMPNMD
jgi:hypothetical protein